MIEATPRVYAGSGIPGGNSLTVSKGQTCLALAVFKLSTSNASHEVSTAQYPRIGPHEWPQIFSEVIREVVGSGEIYGYLNATQIASLDLDMRKAATAAISRRIDQLDRIKSVIAGLGEKGTK